VPSGEITNPELLLSVASKGKPVLMSTGMAELEEVHAAVEMLIRAGTKELALFQCTSSYPTNPEDVNLRVMHTLECEFQVPVGLSDHTEGIEISLAAVALGASLIEKHLTLDRTLDGPDHAASMEPTQLTELIRGIRKVEAALGTGIKRPSSDEREVAKVARRSLVAAESLPEGTKLAREHLLFRRPGTGLPPTHLELVLGKTLTRKVDKGQLISLDLLD
ncbi:MAG TPA: N-acetylneuraminate synthase family protein, partial [Candidatus Melainabacteria bacterium]|nr:N-acetylneuraminate synthase family protein [Candidatus Melainabacteria bacterium]